MENFFTMPGIYLLQALTVHASGLMAFLGATEPTESVVLVVVVSAIVWVLGVTACWGVVALTRNLYRTSEAIIRTMSYRVTQSVRGVRTWLICKHRQFSPRRHVSMEEAMPEVRFDDFDLTVLQAAADCGPGFSTSAGELAGKFGLRPSKFEKSLGKLRTSNMLATIIGSTDGFDNYRVTEYGVAYLQMWEQRKAS
jgi:hypothetical protein